MTSGAGMFLQKWEEICSKMNLKKNLMKNRSRGPDDAAVGNATGITSLWEEMRLGMKSGTMKVKNPKDLLP